MTTISGAAAGTPHSPRFAILHGGLLAGALDILAAIASNAFRGIEALSILQSVATGLLGRAAYDLGLAGAGLGLLLHFLVMFAISAIFYAASRRLVFLVRHAALSGALYGIAVYLFMNFVVLPLSAFPHDLRYSAEALALGLSIHILCVGLPIAFVVKRYSGNPS